MSIDNSTIQNLSNSLWSQYVSGEMNQLTGDSKWQGLGQLGLGLAQGAIQNYVNPALAPKTYTNPVITQIQKTSSIFGTPGADLAAKWQPQINQSNTKLSLLETSSSDPMTSLQGRIRSDNIINEYQTATDNMLSEFKNKPLTGTQQAVVGGAGTLAGMGASMGMNALGNKMFGNSEGGQFATQVLSQGASTVAGNVGSTVANNIVSGASAGTNVGSNLASIFSNAGSLTSLGAGVANIGLDIFDKQKKAKWENGVNIGLGLASLIPGVGPFAALGALAFNGVGHATGQKTESFTADRDLLASTNGAYGGSIRNILNAESLAGIKHSGWDNSGRIKDNNKISEAGRQYDDLAFIMGYNNDRRDISQSNAGILHAGREFEMSGNYNQQGAYFGRKGMTIQKPDSNTEIFLTQEINEFKEGGSLETSITYIELTTEIEEFKEGGSINVIPEGALHARKHNMDIEGITTKGIPVVSEKENGEIEQQAEIEKEEIIFCLEVTKRLEELAKDGSDDAAIEAGKLLVEEILNNTVDNTGLLNIIN